MDATDGMQPGFVKSRGCCMLFEIVKRYIHKSSWNSYCLDGAVLYRYPLPASSTIGDGCNDFARHGIRVNARMASLLVAQIKVDLIYVDWNICVTIRTEATMLQTILRNEMQRRGLSSHTAAEAIGVSHTTILRALRGDKIDVDTIVKIANFLILRPSELLNSMSDTSLADQIAALLSHSRELEDQLREAVSKVKKGDMEPALLKDVVSYALYKFQSGGSANAIPTSPASKANATRKTKRRS